MSFLWQFPATLPCQIGPLRGDSSLQLPPNRSHPLVPIDISLSSCPAESLLALPTCAHDCTSILPSLVLKANKNWSMVGAGKKTNAGSGEAIMRSGREIVEFVSSCCVKAGKLTEFRKKDHVELKQEKIVTLWFNRGVPPSGTHHGQAILGREFIDHRTTPAADSLFSQVPLAFLAASPCTTILGHELTTAALPS